MRQLPEPDLARMQHRLSRLTSREVGGTPGGGVDRPALSDADRAARGVLSGLFQSLSLVERVDDLGSMYGRRSGDEPELAPVLIGSHLDTVSPGGKYDGILGVVAALEAVSLLEDAGIATRRPIDVVNFTGEEGARFPPAMIASGALAGAHDAAFVHAAVDARGLTFGEELRRIGYHGDAAHRPSHIHASLELHIEQGTQLEKQGVPIGIVSGIDPVRWLRVTVRGRGEHAGGPGPAGRRDSAVGAGKMIAAARDLSLGHEALKTTVGIISTTPGSTNVVPHTTSFSLDVRSASDDLLDGAVAELQELFASIATAEGVTAEVAETWRLPATEFDPSIRQNLMDAANILGHPALDITGGIGHDAMNLARVTKSAMVFTPTLNGLSHCEAEESPWDATEKAVDVLAHVLLELANER